MRRVYLCVYASVVGVLNKLAIQKPGIINLLYFMPHSHTLCGLDKYFVYKVPVTCFCLRVPQNRLRISVVGNLKLLSDKIILLTVVICFL